jgi:hypothetical protein
MMTTARAIYLAMKRDAAESGVDIDDFVDSVEDFDGGFLSLVGGDVQCRQEVTGEWVVTAPFGFVRRLAADVPANKIASAVISALLEDDEEYA